MGGSVEAGLRSSGHPQHQPAIAGSPSLDADQNGQVQLFFSPPAPIIPHIKSGRLKAIAVTAESRLSSPPQVPTFAEAGLPDVDVKTWQGVLAPAGTPAAIVEKLSTEIAAIVTMPDTREMLSSQGTDPLISTSEQFTALMKADVAKYGKLIRTANIKLDN